MKDSLIKKLLPDFNAWITLYLLPDTQDTCTTYRTVCKAWSTIIIANNIWKTFLVDHSLDKISNNYYTRIFYTQPARRKNRYLTCDPQGYQISHSGNEPQIEIFKSWETDIRQQFPYLNDELEDLSITVYLKHPARADNLKMIIDNSDLYQHLIKYNVMTMDEIRQLDFQCLSLLDLYGRYITSAFNRLGNEKPSSSAFKSDLKTIISSTKTYELSMLNALKEDLIEDKHSYYHCSWKPRLINHVSKAIQIFEKVIYDASRALSTAKEKPIMHKPTPPEKKQDSCLVM